MSDKDPTFAPGLTQDTATLLLAAAQELGLDASVVVADPGRGGFTAPTEVVAKATSGQEGESSPRATRRPKTSGTAETRTPAVPEDTTQTKE